MSTETTTDPLMLEGNDLEFARELVLWGAWDDAFSFRICMPGGGSLPAVGCDPLEDLKATMDLGGGLGISGFEPRPLHRQDVDALERLARTAVEAPRHVDTAERLAWATRQAAVAKRVLALIPKLRAALPPVHRCETCGHVVTREEDR